MHRCDNLACKACIESNSARITRRIVRRINHGEAYYKSKGLDLGRARHDVLSPPQQEWPESRLLIEGPQGLLARARAILDESCTSDGYLGAIELHCERKKHEDGSECNKKGCRLPHTWVWGPHVHFQGHGWFQRGDAIHSKTQWVFKGIADKYGRDLPATVFYQLTHSAVFTKVETGRALKGYRYVGLISTKKAKLTKVSETWEKAKCPCGPCEGDIHRVGHDQQNRPDYEVDYGPHLVKKPLYRFEERGRKIA